MDINAIGKGSLFNFVIMLLLCSRNFTIDCGIITPFSDRKNLAPSVIKPLISSPELSEESVRMSHLENKEKEEKIDESPEEKPKKTPSKDSPIRWASFVIYMAISTPLMIALIGLAAGLQS